MKDTNDANLQDPPLPLERITQPRELHGFRRGARDGFRFSRPFALILGFTAAAYTFLPITGPNPPFTFNRLLFGCLIVAVYFAAVPAVWCLCAGIVSSIQDWKN